MVRVDTEYVRKVLGRIQRKTSNEKYGGIKMKISKKTGPYSFGNCIWDKESKFWCFSWGEEIHNDWVEFSIINEFPVESINEAYMKDPTNFDLDEDIINEILEDD